ncbi:hypothetical protein E4U55_006820 [Claviceps digitariae]|nr:hypothetical protein E4U55_006820 [Claviceps digitariae]
MTPPMRCVQQDDPRINMTPPMRCVQHLCRFVDHTPKQPNITMDMDNNLSEHDLRVLILQQRRRREEAEERLGPSTFVNFLRDCHELLSVPLTVASPTQSTIGTIPPPNGKFCPRRIELWEDCPGIYRRLFDSVHRYLHGADGNELRLFPNRQEMNGSRRCIQHALDSETDTVIYDHIAVNTNVAEIITELCKIPAAKEEFQLGSAIRFDSHINALERTAAMSNATDQLSSTSQPKSDNYCRNVVDATTNVLLTCTEYKPPHKLPTATINLGLRPMNLWREIVRSETVPTEPDEKDGYKAARLVCSAVVQQYHVMIQEGLEASCVTNGFCDIHLWVPRDNPSTLHYYVFDPNAEIDTEDADFPGWMTKVARRLCLYLLSYSYPIRSQKWRIRAQEELNIWGTGTDYMLHESPNSEQVDVSSNSQNSGPDPGYQASSSREEDSPTVEDRRPPTRAQCGRAPQEAQQLAESPDSSSSDESPVGLQRKRRISLVSPSPQPSSRARNERSGGNSSTQHHAQFCTLHCLLGLQHQGVFDEKCPNIRYHQRNNNTARHAINAKQLVQSLKEQLKSDLDRNCTPFGRCGQSGAPFKLTCAVYGYIVVAKGTTSDWWPQVAQEADVYRVLKKAQASAVPVFLGTIDLAKAYFLHGAGEIRHMLVMSWGGEHPESFSHGSILKELQRSEREIQQLGVTHLDIRLANILWNPEIRRILIIDFHQANLIRPGLKESRSGKKRVKNLENACERRPVKVSQLKEYESA